MSAAPLAAQLTSPSAGGIGALDRRLQLAAESRRVLMIGAHPDDENTALLTVLSQGYGVDAAYLSLTRGDGGQNLIGPELGIGLGLLRTQELASARVIDGAQQFFTRAFDYGFSRTLEEAQKFWPQDSILKDAVRIVRRFRPDVIVAVFQGTPQDGHGQHQMSGVIAKLVFDAAADPNKFPELKEEEGLDPWAVKKFYRALYGATSGHVVQIGVIEPRSGRTYGQIASASRSQHKSQDFGQLQVAQPQRAILRLEATRVDSNAAVDAGDEALGGLFAGIPRDTSWGARFADSLRRNISITRMDDAAAAIAAALPRVRSPRQRNNLEAALAVASGLVMDAWSDEGDVTPGQSFAANVSLFNGSPFPLSVDSITLDLPQGWRAQVDSATPSAVAPNTVGVGRYRITVWENEKPTQPYFLDKPLNGEMYDWTDVPPPLKGQPFAPPLARAVITAHVRGVLVHLSRELSHRYVVQAAGELRRPLSVVPRIDVKLNPSSVLWPSTGTATRTFEVALKYNGQGKVAGRLRLTTGAWPAPAPQSFEFDRTGEMRTYRFTVKRPLGTATAAITVKAIAEVGEGDTSSEGVTLIDYPHVRPTQLVTPATSEVRVAPIALPTIARVGYVRGAADHVPEALSQVGLNVVVLDKDQLERGDLSGYGAIVIGTRAYESDSALMRHNDRLLEYVKNGGLVVVQYQQYPFIDGHYAPYKMSIARPHDRVTDETVPVTILNPADPAVNRPNKIGGDDWDNWPQERGLYFAHDWDPAFHPVLEMNDPGMPPLKGGLLVAKYGTGTYVYTGLSFNRALPAAVPGAFRLFLNLLNLKARDVP